MRIASRPSRALRRAGFTLIELLAAMLILGVLIAFLLPQIPAAIDRAKVTACQANMRAIGEGLVTYRGRFNRLPKGSGVSFFASLIADEVWDGTDSKKLTCPGVELNVLTPEIDGIPREEWYIDKKRLGPDWSTYAGRNMKEHPIRNLDGKNIGSEALVADDNDTEANHRGTTVILYADYAVRPIDIVNERDAGNATPDDPYVVVGPDSWREDLRKLSIHD